MITEVVGKDKTVCLREWSFQEEMATSQIKDPSEKCLIDLSSYSPRSFLKFQSQRGNGMCVLFLFLLGVGVILLSCRPIDDHQPGLKQ